MRAVLLALPGDPLLYGRLFGLAAGIGWIALGSLVVVPIAVLALAILFATVVYSWTAQATHGRPFTLTTAPAGLVITDLVTASLWMIATAPDPRSVAFGLVLIAAALVCFRLGRAGIGLSIAVFAVAVVAQQVVLYAFGAQVEMRPVLREAVVISLVLLVIGVVAIAYRAEQERGSRALRRARLLEQAAAEVAAETDAGTVLASIPRHALELVQADHATLNVHRGSEFHIIAGAGLGTRVIGVHGPATTGIVGKV